MFLMHTKEKLMISYSFVGVLVKLKTFRPTLFYVKH